MEIYKLESVSQKDFDILKRRWKFYDEGEGVWHHGKQENGGEIMTTNKKGIYQFNGMGVIGEDMYSWIGGKVEQLEEMLK